MQAVRETVTEPRENRKTEGIMKQATDTAEVAAIQRNVLHRLTTEPRVYFHPTGDYAPAIKALKATGAVRIVKVDGIHYAILPKTPAN